MRDELRNVPFTTNVRTSKHVKNKDVHQLELEASRRALALIKGRLGSKKLLEIIREDVEQADRQWEAWAKESEAEWRVSRLETEVTGLDLDYWLTWLRSHLGNEEVLFAIHPEHYVWTTKSKLMEDSETDEYVLAEPMAGHILRLYLRAEDWDGYEEYVDPKFPVRMCLALYTQNWVMVGRSIAQYQETADGFIFRLDAMKPVAVPPDMLVDNAEHGRLEYHRCMELARADWCADARDNLRRLA